MQIDTRTIDNRQRLRIWLKKAGLAGFLFFLFKGLVWLAVSGVLFWMGASS